MTGTIHSPVTTAALSHLYEVSPPHLRPIVAATRDHRVGLMIVAQEAGNFRMPKGETRTPLFFLCDDTDQAMAPAGFHPACLRRAMKDSKAFVVEASAIDPKIYGAAAAATASGISVMLIETRVEQEQAWVDLIQKTVPGRPILWSTVEGGHA